MTPAQLHEIARKPPSTPPALSAILLAQGNFESFAKSLHHLFAQSRPELIEILLVVERTDAVPAAQAALASAPDGIAAWSLFEGRLEDRAAASLECIRRAAGEATAFCEDHSFVSRNWAEELAAAFAGDPDVVAAAPAMRNGNPGSSLSRVQLALFFGDCSTRLHPRGRIKVDFLPPHNTAYRKDRLLAATDLRKLLAAENLLQARLLAGNRGASLVLCADATTTHVNMSRLHAAAEHAVLGGRIFGARRAAEAGWTAPRRLLQALLFPAAAAVRLNRKLGSLRRESSGGSRCPDIATAVLLAVLHAYGEARGMIFGDAGCARLYSRMEGERSHCVRAADIPLLLAEA